ncbi:hypothetical protein BJV78DRAFT_1352881 [Lactifluus subvellereus]|nr:hypothetical protein BJV78DRAFT_1352881 [Lactifluus subvellereus]
MPARGKRQHQYSDRHRKKNVPGTLATCRGLSAEYLDMAWEEDKEMAACVAGDRKGIVVFVYLYCPRGIAQSPLRISDFMHIPESSSDMVEPKLDEYFLHDRVVRECESGHDLTFRLEEHCNILSTTDLLALIYEYEIDITTGIREVFNDDVEPEENSNLALSPRSVKAYANPHRGLSHAGQRSSADGSSRADICREEVAGTKEKSACPRGAPRAGLWAGSASEESESPWKFNALIGLFSGIGLYHHATVAQEFPRHITEWMKTQPLREQDRLLEAKTPRRMTAQWLGSTSRG